MTDNCAAFTALLVRAADGSASAEDQARLAAHLATCDACAADLADQRDVHAFLFAQPIGGASLGFDTRVMAAVRAEAESRARGWLDSLDFRRWTWRLVPVAAALALAAITIVQFDRFDQLDQFNVQTGTTVEVTDLASADSAPVSSALLSDSVSSSSLLSLMLSASADDSLATHRKDQ
jgi:anti-sigma factor RsiW